MNLNYQPFVKIIQQLKVQIKDRHRIAAIAIGYACACNSPLPSSEVENAEQHFAVNVAPFTKTVLSGFNEAMVFDTAAALDFARKFWLLRYEAVHKCPRMESMPGDFFCSVFGVPKFFSPQEIAFANEHSRDISSVYTYICNLIKDQFVGA